MTRRKLLALALSFVGCASIPPARYGVDDVDIVGMEDLDEAALLACLATAERERLTFNLGGTARDECGDPPFDRRGLHLGLWRWPWSDWPLYDRNVFERDLQRIERWYRARGYYDARVVSADVQPPAAATSDRVEEDTDCERDADDEGCRVELTVRVTEGEPVMVRHLEIATTEADARARGALPPGLLEDLHDAWRLEEGERFDEALYDRSKVRMLRVLHDRGLGCARVEGHVEIDPEAKTADVVVRIWRGAESELGEIRVVGHEDLREETIRGVAGLDPGDEYTEAALAEAQHFVYALGAFASVDVLGRPRRDDAGRCTGVVDVEIRVKPGRRLRYGVGGGVQAGTYQSSLQTVDVRQWDIHLLGFVEHRNFLGGLRRIRLEARPKLVFQPINDPFPTPRFGIDVRLNFQQPSFIERRTTLVWENRYDFGPDPNDRFFRHVLDSKIALRRSFYDGRVQASFGPHGNVFRVRDDVVATSSDFQVAFLELGLQLDLRDDSRSPTRGIYAAMDVQVARFLSWDYVRLIPDVRVYAPLGRVVAAARFRLGTMHIQRASADLDPVSQQLGPQLYRLRSGGASSNRGFVAGFLGDPSEASGDPARPFRRNSGGIRRWEASLEFRLPISEDFGVVVFSDAADVNREAEFRFDHLHLSIGGGLRYDTIIGPIRFDIGWRVRRAQILGEEDVDAGTNVRFLGLPINGAFHFTIGEAF